MKTVIVTGGSGYIGSGICTELVKKGYRVINLDRESSYLITSNVIDILGDIRFLSPNETADEIILNTNGGPIEGIIHLASYKDIEGSILNPIVYYENNIATTLVTLQIARILNVKKFIFSSSAAVYPDRHNVEVMMEEDATGGNSAYGRSKLYCENIIKDAMKSIGGQSISLRYQNPIGVTEESKMDLSDSIFGNIMKCINSDTTFTIYGGNYPSEDGTCIRDYVDLQNIVDVHIELLSKNLPQELSNCEINIGRGKPVSCLEVCKEVSKLYPNFKYKIGEPRLGDVVGSYASIGRLMSIIPSLNLISLEDSIKNMIERQNSNEIVSYGI